MKACLITGGAGFIGSSFVLAMHECRQGQIINLDLLTYAANPLNLQTLASSPDYRFVRGDIGDRGLVRNLLETCHPLAVVNFAAESHVDRSIDGPEDFIQTNVLGTFHLLEEVRHYWQSLPANEQQHFRFLHVSTDEVYGSLGPGDPAFHESTPYAPNSPYSASKAASDHLVRAYHHTYGLPTLTTNCSNNYGPRQFPEKLIPLMILNALQGKSLPVYGDGLNVRDWLYVEDHCDALHQVLERGCVGEVYNIGGNCEKTNLDVVTTLCRLLDEMIPDSSHRPHADLVRFVKDRPGHDRRYAIDSAKIGRELGWRPKESFESGLRKTIAWYLNNSDWVRSVQTGVYRQWIEHHYG
ncbi:MAG TPA: dTDP-glucose 4,6-dehydratase [Syntrophobacteraceae bacterium]|nr:dTDP-glucose 4,6-dehydratase [Syntrophobacteraceae bacterium]